jgi:hypothetical protein
MANNRSNKAMEDLKWETARELGIQIPSDGYLGDLPSRMNGMIGGNMVKKMIASYGNSAASGNIPQPPQNNAFMR